MASERDDGGRLSPETVARATFGTGFRGFDQDEVRTYLSRVAAELRDARDHESELRLALAAAEERARRAVEIDDETVTRYLGEETARVLIAAREAAADIRAKAEESVARLVKEANDNAARVREEADVVRRTALEEAEAEAARLRESVAAETETAKAEASRLRDEAAEESAAVRLAADEASRKARLEAERAADRLRAEAAELAEADIEAAKSEGRALIEEARAVRQRVLDDLAAKRKAAKVQLERLRAGRDRLLEAYEVVRRSLAEVTAELEGSVDAARVAADVAGRRVEIEAADSAADLEVELAAAELAEDEVEVDEDDEHEGDGEDDVDVADQVDELFARLRASRAAPPDEDEVREAAQPPGGAASETGYIAEGGAGEDEVRVAQDNTAQPPGGAASGARNIGEAGDGEDEVRVAQDDIASLLERRDATTDAVEHQLARRLKRVLSDEQNEVLDRLRRNPGGNSDVVMADAAEQQARYAQRAAPDLAEAAAAGSVFFGDAMPADVEVTDLAEELASVIADQVRHRITTTLHDAAGDDDALADGIRACYREWKTQRIGDTARHYVLVAFTRGVFEATAEQASLRWLVDDGGSPCPDAEDNALAGALTKGEPFPTGHQYPPAHPGCRCLVVPESH